jgi:hypothetical protein
VIVAGFELVDDRKNFASGEIERCENHDSIDPLGFFERWGVHGEIDLHGVAVAANDVPLITTFRIMKAAPPASA